MQTLHKKMTSKRCMQAYIARKINKELKYVSENVDIRTCKEKKCNGNILMEKLF